MLRQWMKSNFFDHVHSFSMSSVAQSQPSHHSTIIQEAHTNLKATICRHTRGDGVSLGEPKTTGMQHTTGVAMDSSRRR